MQVHIVRQGECLSSIAHQYGFSSYRTIYDHAQNADFRKKRPDPAVICPGDEIAIPDVKTKTVTLATGERHRIVLKRPAARLRVRLRDRDGTAIANQDYTLKYAGGQASGRTDGEGLVDQKVPASVSEALVELVALGFSLRLRCGTVDPIDTVTGVQVRLNNLGFGVGAVDGVVGPRTQEAIQRFQEDHQLPASGDLDDETRRQLVLAHGC